MPPKQTKKTLWVECERCGCSITSNDRNVHAELNCAKDQLKCPFVADRILYTWVMRTGAAPDDAPKDAVMIHSSAASLIGAVIGGALELSRDGVPSMVKRMWPSKASSLAAIVLPAGGKLYKSDTINMCYIFIIQKIYLYILVKWIRTTNI